MSGQEGWEVWRGGRRGYRQIRDGNWLMSDLTDSMNHPVLISSSTHLTAGAITWHFSTTSY